MNKFELVSLGTPVMDIFYEADYSFLEKHGLCTSCTNHLTDLQVSEIENELVQIHQSAGDNARNVCEAFSMSGDKNCAYIGNVGKDEIAKQIRENLKDKKITDLMKRVDGKTGRILCIITPDKQRTFAVYLGVGDLQVEHSSLSAPKIFFCTSITLFSKGIGKSAFDMCKKFKQNGSRIAISLESENLLKKNIANISEVFALADYLFLNEDEMHAIGKNEQTVATIAPVVFLKRGANGASVYENGKKLADVSAQKVDVKDTTGAGDFFAGATLNAILGGRNFVESARAGNEMAGQVISRVGASV